MKNIIISTLFAACCFHAAAQQQEAVSAKQKKVTDSARPAKDGYYVPDSLHTKSPARIKSKTTATMMIINPGKPKNIKLSAVTYKTASSVFITKDSVYKLQQPLLYKTDSLRKKLISLQEHGDTARRKKSLFTRKAMEFTKDSIQNVLEKHRVAESKKLYQAKFTYDSLKLQQYLLHKKNLLLRMESDSVQIKSGYRVKKLYITMPCTETDTVFIKNNYRKIQVFTNTGSGVSASTKLAYKDSIKASDEILMNKIGVTLNRSGKSITVLVNGITTQKIPGNDEFKDILQNDMNLKNTVSIMVPANVVVVINTSNAEANVESYVRTFKTEVTNGTLVLKSADDATIKGNYSTITAGTIKNADVVMKTSTINITSVNAMKISSASSMINLKECHNLHVTQSSGDGFVVDKAVTITGNKSFGKLTVANLEGKMSLSGTGSFIAVNNFSNTNPQVAITGKYSDVKLALSKLPDYAVYYEGSLNDVNRTSSVTKQLNSLGRLSATLTLQKDTINPGSKYQSKTKTILTANAGNINGAHTKIDIVCPYCNVVFY